MGRGEHSAAKSVPKGVRSKQVVVNKTRDVANTRKGNDTNSVSSTDTIRGKILSYNKGNAGGILIDSSERVVNQGLRREDKASFTAQASLCLKASEWSTLNPTDDCYKIMGVNWSVPTILTDSGGSQYLDSRGIYQSLEKGKLKCENLTNSPITICFNTPKSRQPNPQNVAYRTPEQRVEIGPFKSHTFQMTWANNVNENPLMKTSSYKPSNGDYDVSYLAPDVRLCDFCVIIPDINYEANEAIKDETDIVKFEISTVYRVTGPEGGMSGQVFITQSGDRNLSNRVLINRSNLFNVVHMQNLIAMYALSPVFTSIESDGQAVNFLKFVYNDGDVADIVCPRSFKYISDNTWGYCLCYGYAAKNPTSQWTPAVIGDEIEGSYLLTPFEINGRRLWVYRTAVEIEEFDQTTATKSGWFLTDDFRLNNPKFYGETKPDNEVMSHSWMSIDYTVKYLQSTKNPEKLTKIGEGMYLRRDGYVHVEDEFWSKFVTFVVGASKILTVIAEVLA